ncbi:DUF7507 domain-containing protein [Ardenticatena maritima]|nr:IPT/TIG domain-containing protein [Ardenticatena maritima]
MQLFARVPRRILFLLVSFLVTLAFGFLASLGLFWPYTASARNIPTFHFAHTPTSTNVDPLLAIVEDDSEQDFFQGRGYLTGVSRRSAPVGDGNGEITLLAIGLAGDWYTMPNPQGLPDIKEHTVEIFKDAQGTEHLYVIGGRVGGLAQNTIYHTTIITSNVPDTPDIPGAWELLPSTLPSSLYGHQSVIWNNYLYVIGGIDQNFVVTDTVFFASIDPQNGSLSAFSPTASLPISSAIGLCDEIQSGETGRARISAVVMSDTIYVIGGQPGILDGSTCVFAAHPQADGTISEWVRLSENLPEKVFGSTAVAYEGRIYNMGGSDTSSNVYYAAPLVPTDTIPGGWIPTQPLPEHRRYAAAVEYNGQFLVIGGASGTSLTNASDKVTTGIARPDGGVDFWFETKALDPARFLHDAVISSRGWIYVIGGASGGLASDGMNDISYGSMSGAASQYAPYGEFVSRPIVLFSNRTLRELRWTTFISPTLDLTTTPVTVTIEYRTASGSLSNLLKAPWVGPFHSTYTQTVRLPDGIYTDSIQFPAGTSGQFFQYRIRMGTTFTKTTPAVQRVQLVYEVPPPDLWVSKTSLNTGFISRGSLITYSIQYGNRASAFDSIASNAVLTETFPSYVDFVEASHPFVFAGTTQTGDRIYTADLGQVSPGITNTITFTLRVTDVIEALPLQNERPVITNTVQIGYPGPDADPGNNQMQILNDLEVVRFDFTKLNTPQGLVVPGQEIQYTLNISNTSNLPARNVIVEDAVPTNTTYIVGSETHPAGFTFQYDTNRTPPVLRWMIGEIPPHSGGTFTFKVQVNTDVEAFSGDDIFNSAVISSTDSLPKFSNAVFNTITTTVQLDIRKEALPAVAKAGDEVVYRIVYTNTGNVDLTEVVLTDTVPALTTYVTGSISGPGADDTNLPELRWNIGSVPIGQSGEVSFRVRVDRPLPAGTTVITNTAQARTLSTKDLMSNESVLTLTSRPVLHISKRAQPSSGVQPGDVITFTLAFTNTGDMDATGIVVTDRLPLNTTLLQPYGAVLVGDVLSWTWPTDLAGLGGSGVVSYTVHVDDVSGGGIANTSYSIKDAHGHTASGAPVFVPVAGDFWASNLVASRTVLRTNETVVIHFDAHMTGMPRVDQLPDPTTWGIWADLYVFPQPTPPDRMALSNVDTYWYVNGASLQNGSVKLSSDTTTGGSLTSFTTSGTYYIYAQVNTDDGDGDPSDGWPLPEWPETNNIVGPLVITVTDAIAPSPEVISVSPARVPAQDGQSITISGNNFADGATVWVQKGVSRIDGVISSLTGSQITATFDLQGQLGGAWDVYVRNPDGGTGVLPGGLLIETNAVVCPPDCNVYLPAIFR